MSEIRVAPRLLDEPPISVYPSLAVALGVNKAIVFQQLHFLLNGQRTAKNEYNFVDGRWWVYNSYAEWKEQYFPWQSESSLKGYFTELEAAGLVLSRQSVKKASDRRKWYTIDYEAWDKFCLTMGQKLSDQSSDKNCPMVGQKLSDDSSKNSSETSSKTLNRENTPGGAGQSQDEPAPAVVEESIPAAVAATPPTPPVPPPPSSPKKKAGAKKGKRDKQTAFRAEWDEHKAWGEALLQAFGHDLIWQKPNEMPMAALEPYLNAAKQLRPLFAPDALQGLHTFVAAKAQAGNWSGFGVMTLVKYSIEYRQQKPTPAVSEISDKQPSTSEHDEGRRRIAAANMARVREAQMKGTT